MSIEKRVKFSFQTSIRKDPVEVSKELGWTTIKVYDGGDWMGRMKWKSLTFTPQDVNNLIFALKYCRDVEILPGEE